MPWYTLVGGVTGATDVNRELVEGPCTVRRLLVQISGGHAQDGVAAFASFHWIVNVGLAAADPNVFGLDAASTMLHGAALIPDAVDLPVRTAPPGIDIDDEGMRIVPAGQSLWMRIRGGAPATGWAWVWNIRVLVTT